MIIVNKNVSVVPTPRYTELEQCLRPFALRSSVSIINYNIKLKKKRFRNSVCVCVILYENK